MDKKQLESLGWKLRSTKSVRLTDSKLEIRTLDGSTITIEAVHNYVQEYTALEIEVVDDDSDEWVELD